MKRLLGLILTVAAGCPGFEHPTSDRLEGLPLDLEDRASSPRSSSYTRCRFRMSIDGGPLAGEFEGVLVAHRTPANPVLRVQVFGDLGPKIVDLTARPDRIIGYFPQTREGVDCALPREAAPHLLLFMGASLVEEFLTEVDRGRVTGVREVEGGSWLRLRPAIEGLETDRFMNRSRETKKRRFCWMYGVRWQEDWPKPEECRITAPDLSIRIKILERTHQPPVKLEPIEGMLPADIRIVRGSRK